MLPVAAVQPDEVLADAALEARARALSLQLRCMVCQNQSIDDSDAPLARDLRILVRERLKAGDSDTQIREFLVARYGQFVLLEPEKNRRTALLWLAPLIVLLAGGLVLLRFFSRRRAAPIPLTAAEKKRLKELT
ncbi:MAG: cytochrome c-type biogenesis protein CcmH [Rhizobiales bacterium]|nr:cytochrome c-type biogenesis protein CcmH [Hyphomicrobiales bacterium]